jgi:hypothetical protein
MATMNPLQPMLIIVLSGILGFLLVFGIVMALKPDSQSAGSPLPVEVIERSKKYVASLTAKPFQELNTNQKLILIHSYYNLGNYKMVVQYAETMVDELRQLPQERKIAFVDMIEQSYRQLGQDQIITEFREAIGF